LDLLSDLKSVNELPFSFTTQDLTRFFCGITTPRSTKHKLKMLPGFGRLSRYPYDAVRQEVAALLK
jgi:hypothetical protein